MKSIFTTLNIRKTDDVNAQSQSLLIFNKNIHPLNISSM